MNWRSRRPWNGGAPLCWLRPRRRKGVAPSLVLTDAVAPCVECGGPATRRSGPAGGRRASSCGFERPLEVATLLLARGARTRSAGAGGASALVEACDDADFAARQERAATAAAGDASALTRPAALARGPRGGSRGFIGARRASFFSRIRSRPRGRFREVRGGRRRATERGVYNLCRARRPPDGAARAAVRRSRRSRRSVILFKSWTARA